MAYYTDEDDLHPEVRPLSQTERRWVERLERVLQACPTKRVALLTHGDCDLIVMDDNIARRDDLELHDGNCTQNGLTLAHVQGKPLVHGVSG